MNSSRSKGVSAPSVLRPVKNKDGHWQLTMTTPRGKSGGCCAITAITESSGDTGTVIYFEGWLTT